MNKTTLQVKDWLAHRLDSAISDSGMKIEAICKKTGMPYSTLNAKRRGYSSISFEDIVLLAPILGLSASSFVPPQFSSLERAA
ncbi:helix-turn-helix domain-containing protein [Bifidobacterium mongoliense]|uniref:helix-turn-helix domain-containing protein n=1 Tax=Bifidobacterium mongoliense TaxID=518643 RepID=UPI000F4CC714|nr:helix-turn-helix transcriptional regulator [Bifidobacterium mongoliense]